MEAMIRDILRSHGDLAVPVEGLSIHADLFDAGLSSFGTVEVMIALEERLGASLPESMLTRSTFQSIASLCAAAETLRATKAAA